MPATVSFILPVHDAVETLDESLDRLLRVDLGHPELRREIIAVDDASTDGSTEALRRAAARGIARVCFHAESLGHGAMLSTALAQVTGDIVVVADATMAYDASECARLLAPILSGSADVVYGSRYVATTRHVPKLWDRVADQLVTALSNGLTNVALTDVTTSCIAFRADAVRGAVLRADGCGVAAELASLFTGRACRIFEVPVAYRPRRTVGAGMRWFETASHVTMMARCRLRSWRVAPLAPHAPFHLGVPETAQRVRLTRLLRPIDLMPMSPAAARPMLRAN